MVNAIVRTIVAVGALCHIAVAQTQPKTHMTKEQVIVAAKRAIEARFPWAAAKNYSYDAFVSRDGIWGVYVPHPDRPGMKGGGDPNAEVRDTDGQVLKIYLAK